MMAENNVREILKSMSSPKPPVDRGAREIPGGGFFLPAEGTMPNFDSATDSAPGTALSRIPTAFSVARGFGTEYIQDAELSFIVRREPVIHWITWYVAQDIFDNGFRAYIKDWKNDDEFDDAVQKLWRDLKASREYPRSTAFERLYGTSVIVCGYQGSSDWTESIYDVGGGLKAGLKLVQLTPYPWSQVNIDSLDEDDTSLRYGLPLEYEITRTDTTKPFKVHWTKVIHDAPRLFDHPYEGMSVVEILYDDATGYRNMRWGLYQTIFRYGSGFPHIHLPWATRRQIQALINAGEFDYINSRGLFVTGGKGENKEEIDFKGMQGATLDPKPYIDAAFESFSLGSRIPQDIFKGASAGRITGSEFNERNYYKYISSEQTSKEPIVREFINRLLETGQIELEDKRRKLNRDTEYLIEWKSAYVLNEVDQTRIYLWESTAYKNYTEFMTVNEVRDLKKLGPIDGGDRVLGIERIKAQQMRMEFNPPQEPKGKTQPEEGEVQGNRPEER
jgi:hypothetical protein